MIERLPEDRLGQIRAEIEADCYGHSYDGGHAARELLDEVDRFRALEAPGALVKPSDDAITPEQVAEWQAAWNELCAPGVIGYDLAPPPVPDSPPPPPIWNPFRDGPRRREDDA